MARPNILLIYADQHRFDCVGANGHPLVETPNLDRLAREGLNFTQAHTPIPVCVPARNCFVHGQWSTRHLAIANHDTEAPRPPDPGLPTFGQVLREAGYALGWVGKWHVHPHLGPTDPAYGFHTYIDEREYYSWRAQRGFPPRPRDVGWTGGLDPDVPPAATRLAWGADQTLELLESLAHQDEPFFIRWDPSEPHLPNVVPEPYASLYPPEAIAPWPSFPDPLVGKPYIQAQMRRTWGVADWTWDQWAPIVGRYLGEIALLDAQIGRLLAALDRLGLADNTLVVYSADHGDMCGGHGMVDKHFIMYDDVVRVPLLARWPARIAPRGACDAFVSNAIDLAATFCDVAGAPVPDTFQGQSLSPIFDGAPGNGREDIFCVYHGNQFGLYSQRMVRDRRWKYVWNATAEDELYDLNADPGEIRNLVSEVGCRAQRERLQERLVAWMEQTGDRLLNSGTRAAMTAR